MRHTQLIIRIANFALVLLIAWMAAGLTWRVVAPKPPATEARPSATVAVVAAGTLPDLSAVAMLFGATGPVGDPNQVVPSTLGIKLRGVIAAHGDRPAAATFVGADPKEIAVKVGDEIQPGVKLLEVNADYVIVQHNGRRERIDLDAKPALQIGGVAMQPAPAPAGPAGMMPGTAMPAGAPPGLMPLTVPRAALVGAMQNGNIAEWAAGLRPDTAGGIRIEGGGAQALVSALQLRDGDVLRRINGAQLARPGDITLVYNEFTQKNKVQLDIVRNGRPVTLDYTLQP
ncbi:type II secretion system protein N [Chitinivorax sp. PXF-14]|uniref:type II secretion system protein N n=1 Tax=Chitinivorax sp. PXF-14 TaxID=3230488 RepID=UPI003466413F